MSQAKPAPRKNAGDSRPMADTRSFSQYEPTRRIRRGGRPALRKFVDQRGRLPTAESWTEAAMRPSEKTIRRRFGSFRGAIQRAGLSLD
jgi:hypothetical protein